MSPIITMFSIRARHSRGELEWSVHIEPSWPVFIAASRSKHSWPRISPRMMRSGRIRSALMTRSRMVIAPWPSRLGGRVSSGSQCGCCRRSSAASSMVMTRSPGSIIFDRALSIVVLPEPVPPEMTMFMRQAPAILSAVAIFSDIEPKPRHHVERDRLVGEFTNRDGGAAQRQRRDDDVDAAAVLQAGVGQRRGLVDAAADLVDDPLGDLEQMLLVAELDLGELQLALAFDEGLVGTVDHDVADRRIGRAIPRAARGRAVRRPAPFRARTARGG